MDRATFGALFQVHRTTILRWERDEKPDPPEAVLRWMREELTKFRADRVLDTAPEQARAAS